MSTLSNLVWQLGQKLGDTGDIATSPYQKVLALNNGNRYVRELARKYNPLYLQTTESGTATTATNTLTATPIKLGEIRVDGVLINPIDPRTIADKTSTGVITNYWVTGVNTLNWYPVPRNSQAFTVSMIASSTEWDFDSTSTWIAEIEDCIIEYAYMFLARQTDNLPSLTDRVIAIISNRETGDQDVQGYWNQSARGDSW